jgi:cobalamin biosynthesis protein CobD/CbiB
MFMFVLLAEPRLWWKPLSEVHKLQEALTNRLGNRSRLQQSGKVAGKAALVMLTSVSSYLSLPALVFHFAVFLAHSPLSVLNISCQYIAPRKGLGRTKLMRWAEPAVDIPWSIPGGDAAGAC